MHGPTPEKKVDREALTTAGLGLDYSVLRLARTTGAWVAAGQVLAERVAAVLDGSVAAVEPVGSSSVPGLLAKPIIDLAVGVRSDQRFAPVQRRLLNDGWIYRGDAGSDGGRLFVLETRPRYRVAHLHVVGHGDEQWRNYLRFRDLLRRDPRARRRYEAVKTALAAEGVDRRSYTAGKTEVVAALLHADRALGEEGRRARRSLP
ncbi:GrpB family protein [Microlunatus soli]|uniref:GrpB domain, predicted nucleotidyltransferase, UPF0157 family n=1 Tax=Microlunatus soli TaxID=630515 RepID=A0A1H1ZYH0_9ACTN|nr:GrpB family protein [Microlunatus soli]SDT38639.1 GrpB domain, predicted nucleotidyltransferase, UPF0157 family [Microlunatus soli]